MVRRELVFTACGPAPGRYHPPMRTLRSFTLNLPSLLLASTFVLIPLGACGDSGGETTASSTQNPTSAGPTTETETSDPSTSETGTNPTGTETEGTTGTQTSDPSTDSATSSSTDPSTGTGSTGTASCEELLQDIVDFLDGIGSCGDNSECTVFESGFCGPNGEGGCAFFPNINDDTSGWAALTQAYLDAGCPTADCDCAQPMGAECLDGQCHGVF